MKIKKITQRSHENPENKPAENPEKSHNCFAVFRLIGNAEIISQYNEAAFELSKKW